MKLLAVQIRLVVTPEKRLGAEAEFLFDTGDTVLKSIEVNGPHIFHLEDIEKEVKPPQPE